MAQVEDEIAIGHIDNSIYALCDRIALSTLSETCRIADIRAANERHLTFNKGLSLLGKALHRPFAIAIDCIGAGIAPEEDLVERRQITVFLIVAVGPAVCRRSIVAAACPVDTAFW